MYDFYKMEAPYVANAYHGVGDKWDKIFVAMGATPVIISAPHSITTSNNGVVHKAECYTGAIAEILQKETNCSCLTNRKYIKDNEPNTNKNNNDYKKYLASIIKSTNAKLLLDIHGTKPDLNCDIELAVDGFKNCDEEIVVTLFNSLASEGFVVHIDEKFKANENRIISKWAKTTFGVNSIDIKINKSLRELTDELAKERLQILTDVLIKFILSI